MSGIIVLMRHGQSEGNAHGTFTGLIDSPLTKTGEQESERAGAFLRSKGLSSIMHLHPAFNALAVVVRSFSHPAQSVAGPS